MYKHEQTTDKKLKRIPVLVSSFEALPAVSKAGVFGLLHRQLAGCCGPGSGTGLNPATTGSAPPPSETRPTAGPFGPGL